MNTSIESQMKELLDREQIRDLVHRYCWAVDRGTLEEVMALFHTECNLALVPGTRYPGREATHKWYSVYMQNRMEVLRHLIHNQVITVDGDTATSKSYFDAVGDLKGESITVAGFYEDTLFRVNSEWKFTEKVIKLDFLVPLQEGWGGKRIKRNLVPRKV
ncbi:MAG: nuclear transport factor 2 family protein [Deltaproteobacteria bacterium]|nr:nuclear transport factor 2 family protein [Deltaproteobacteria bacterium]